MPIVPVNKKKRRLFKAVGVFIIIAAAYALLVVWHNISLYKESKKYIDMIVAAQLDISDPNTLTAQDYEKVEDVMLRIYYLKTLQPILKMKNLKRLTFLCLAEKSNKEINFDQLGKLKNLRELDISTIYISYIRPPVSTKRRLYNLILAIWHKIKSPSPQEKQFDLSRLRKLKQLESLGVNYKHAHNYEFLTTLPNLKQLRLGDSANNKEREELQKILPGINIKYSIDY